MNATVAAPADQARPTADLDQIRAAARFGTIGFDRYVAMVKAESERLFNARLGSIKESP